MHKLRISPHRSCAVYAGDLWYFLGQITGGIVFLIVVTHFGHLIGAVV